MSSTEQMLLENELLDATSPNGVWELPCGYLDEEEVLHKEVKVRELTGMEEDILGSKKIPSDKKMNMLLINCTERIGTIENKQKITRIIPKMTIGDRSFLFFAIRRTSLGDVFPFREKCPGCNAMSVYPFDLATLKVQGMPEPDKRIFEAQMPSSKKYVKFKCLTGEDEERRDKMAKKIPPATLALMLRLVEIDGATPTVRDIQMLSTRDRDFLRTQFASVDGGIETTVELRCPQCGVEYERELNPGQASFFFPSESQQIWSRRSSF